MLSEALSPRVEMPVRKLKFSVILVGRTKGRATGAYTNRSKYHEGGSCGFYTSAAG